MLSAFVGLCLAGTVARVEIPLSPFESVAAQSKPAASPTVTDEAIRRLVERATQGTDDGDAAGKALQKIGSRAVPFLIERLAKGDADGTFSISLAEHLAGFGVRAKEPVLQGLAKGSRNGRVAMAYTLLKMAARLEPRRLDTLIYDIAKPEPGSAEYERFRFLKEEDVYQAVLANLREHSSEVGSNYSAEFFSYVGGKRAVDDLRVACREGDFFVAADSLGALLWILEKREAAEARAIFDRIYNSPIKEEFDGGHDMRLLQVMGNIKDESGLGRTLAIDLLGHPAWPVRRAAVDWVGIFCPVPTRAKLEALLKGDPQAEVKRSALFALAGTFQKSYVAKVATYAASSEPLDRVCAAEAAGVLQPADGLPLLLRLATDKEAAVRKGAAIALAKSGDPAAVAALKTLAKDPDAEVRESAKPRKE
ncbi:MAG: HEAT repeat domain-containing protein [Fimbriimonas sp.]